MEKNKRVATLLNPPNSFVGTPSAFCLRTSAFLTYWQFSLIGVFPSSTQTALLHLNP
ncbi:hypothetical protein [Scytonema sp. PCC 10023]|uniref:hypothetical protein n=1 Tax=Scytonema sp. PCC 10023 TaxID=1680591 RepID=UPI0039C6DD51